MLVLYNVLNVFWLACRSTSTPKSIVHILKIWIITHFLILRTSALDEVTYLKRPILIESIYDHVRHNKC